MGHSFLKRVDKETSCLKDIVNFGNAKNWLGFHIATVIKVISQGRRNQAGDFKMAIV